MTFRAVKGGGYAGWYFVFTYYMQYWPDAAPFATPLGNVTSTWRKTTQGGTLKTTKA